MYVKRRPASNPAGRDADQPTVVPTNPPADETPTPLPSQTNSELQGRLAEAGRSLERIGAELAELGRALAGKPEATGGETDPPPVDKDAANGPLAGRRILVAEDGVSNQVLVRMILTKAGASVQLVDNGRLAVQRGLAEQFDLVLMDIQMPELDGYEATRQLRSGGFSAPIVALTAFAAEGERDRCEQAGCDDYVTKPIRQDDLIDVAVRYTQAGRDRTGQAKPAGASKPSEATTEAPLDVSVKPPTVAPAEFITSEFADDPDLADIIEPFVIDLPVQVEAMRQALAGGCMDDLRRQAHQLKGAGGGYGYPKITEDARELEQAAKADDIELAGPAMVKLEATCQAVVRGMERNGAQSS